MGNNNMEFIIMIILFIYSCLSKLWSVVFLISKLDLEPGGIKSSFIAAPSSLQGRSPVAFQSRERLRLPQVRLLVSKYI